ncbi:YcbK family protein [Anoxynatronum buryatiense]|uniref:Murein endopeptidase K n=1 Tax=Anoxynatronum buryatiense TaxID=489973 RepID=A0AA45WWF4_9CLOT|nr:D-Ala-D-Ala carboxypeptidase family metallohydrolase [Anoxynatronum buryatiense]SMP57148.1 Peptidase M15 [Anoxynatronum buryatiense]
MTVMNRIKVSENFYLREFECKDGSHQVRLHPQLLEKLQQLRNKLKRPVIITSGYRNPAHNARVGGSPTSQHLLGTAADLQVTGVSIHQLALEARQVGFTGIGIYDTFVHVDVRATPASWDHRSG